MSTTPEVQPELIPFDLERAKAGEPIIRRNGKAARIVAFVPEADYCHRIVYLSEGEVWSCAEDGLFDSDQGETVLDIFMAPTAPSRKGFSPLEASVVSSTFTGDEPVPSEPASLTSSSEVAA